MIQVNSTVVVFVTTDDPHIYRQAQALEWDMEDELLPELPEGWIAVSYWESLDVKDDPALAEIAELLALYSDNLNIPFDFLVVRYNGSEEDLKGVGIPIK